MRIAVVLTYPVYHDGWTNAQWLAMENQNRWIPGVLKELEHEVELWVGAHDAETWVSQMEGFPDYPIRIFETDVVDRRTKFHESAAMVAHAEADPMDAYVLKGVDGGLGTHLLKAHILPRGLPHIVVLGGGYYSRLLPEATAVLTESAYQEEQLTGPGWRFWRKRVEPSKLIRHPKSVDTRRFRPYPEIEPEYDVIAVSRLSRRNKSFAELGALSEHVSVAVVGGGEDEAALRKRYPRIEWLGRVPNAEIPPYLNLGRLNLHPARRGLIPDRDFFPRNLAEAAACGTPSIAFADVVKPDVFPEACGLRIARRDVVPAVTGLLAEPARLEAMRHAARAWAERDLHRRSITPALRQALRLVEIEQCRVDGSKGWRR